MDGKCYSSVIARMSLMCPRQWVLKARQDCHLLMSLRASACNQFKQVDENIKCVKHCERDIQAAAGKGKVWLDTQNRCQQMFATSVK